MKDLFDSIRIENVLTSSSQAGLRVYWQSSSSIILLVPAHKSSATFTRGFEHMV